MLSVQQAICLTKKPTPGIDLLIKLLWLQSSLFNPWMTILTKWLTNWMSSYKLQFLSSPNINLFGHVCTRRWVSTGFLYSAIRFHTKISSKGWRWAWAHQASVRSELDYMDRLQLGCNHMLKPRPARSPAHPMTTLSNNQTSGAKQFLFSQWSPSKQKSFTVIT